MLDFNNANFESNPISRSNFCNLVGCVEDVRRLAIFQPYRDLEVGGNESLKS